ncbi:MAG: hypothetical protein AAGA12_03805 [Pseudomonadota bacterium]
MSLTITPDAARPHGGYATLTVDPAPVESEVTVAVFGSYSERHLGAQGWQADPVSFGPYPVENGSLTIGPEIVNQLEEYEALKITIGTRSFQTSWPDDVVPAPGAATLGGIVSGGPRETEVVPPIPVTLPKDNQSDDNLTGEDDRETEESGEHTPIDAGSQSGTEDDIKKGGSRGAVMWIAALVLLAVLAGAAWYFLQEDTPAPEPEPTPAPAPAPAPEPQADACGSDAIAATGAQGFSATAALLRQCAGEVSPDTALGLLESAARAENPDALALFGKIYDGDATDDALESQMGLTFPDAPATAAGYYARGVAAGSSEAQQLLGALCARLSTMTGTLDVAAFEDHCSE